MNEIHLPRGWESADDLMTCEAGRAYILSQLDPRSEAIEPDYYFSSSNPRADACSYRIFSYGSLWFVNNAEDEVHSDARDWTVDNLVNSSNKLWDKRSWYEYDGCDCTVIDAMDRELLIHVLGEDEAKDSFVTNGGYIEA